MELPILHEQALQATQRLVDGVKVDQLGDPTPDEEWDVRTLLNHVVAGNFWVGELVAGKTIEEVGDKLDGDVLGDDPASAYRASAEVAGPAFKQAGAMERPVAVSYGPVPGEVYAGHRFIDVLVHGWDLAKATGQDSTLDPELVVACLAVIEPQKDMLAGSGAFGTTVEIPDDADPQTKLLAVLGRRA
ncbi:MAG: hypothetical protein QOJ09_2655 [Actinomycetota bacterium]|jgi:uncharacterized protein (TIGR03086 family)|nr:hypothetical protein [Actinomycetota bacterium]